MAHLVGVIIHDEADKVMEALLTIIHDGQEERGQRLPKGGEVQFRGLSLDSRLSLERLCE